MSNYEQFLLNHKENGAKPFFAHLHEAHVFDLGNSMLCIKSFGAAVRISTYFGRVAIRYGGWETAKRGKSRVGGKRV